MIKEIHIDKDKGTNPSTVYDCLVFIGLKERLKDFSNSESLERGYDISFGESIHQSQLDYQTIVDAVTRCINESDVVHMRIKHRTVDDDSFPVIALDSRKRTVGLTIEKRSIGHLNLKIST